MAADGSIKISIDVDGKQVDVASKGLDKLEDAGRNAGKGVKETEKGLKDTGKESTTAGGKIKKFATALGLVAVGAAAFGVLKSSMDAAISRFDTLNKFPKVLQALGVSAEDSERAMSRLSDGIDGLPTTLNEIAGSAQRMYTSFNDMDKATDSALALNNALLGSGSSAADAQRGTEQYIKFLQTGKMEMDTWNTLQETMDIGLIKIAESFGYAGKTAKQDLYNALKDGIITADEFNDKLIEVGTGTGIMAKLAKENSLGIATSLGNLRNAAARGIANIIDSFNKLSKEVTGKDISQNIDGMKSIVNQAFKVVQNVIESTTPYVKGFASAIKATLPVINALSPALIGLASAYAIHKVIYLTTTAIKANTTVVAVATTAKNAYAIATNRLALAMTLALVQQKIMTVATLAYSKILATAITVQTMLAAGMSLSSIAAYGLSVAISVLGTAIKVLMGPVGWVTLAIGALAGATVAIVKWFNKATAEGAKLSKQTEDLADSTETLSSNVEDSARTYEKSRKNIDANAEAYQKLADKAQELAAKEKLTGEEKKELNTYIEELNRNVSGLNLVYGEQTKALSASSEQIANRINLMKEEEKLQAAQERLTEILKEQAEIGMQQEEITALREEWNQKLEDGSVKGREHKKALEELEEQEVSLSEVNKLAGEERLKIEQQIIESSAAVAAAAERDTGRQLLMFDELSESQQKTVESMKSSWEDYKSAATDMFDTLSEKSEVSVGEMTKNLQENQRIISEWSENIAKLAERGVDEGLLNTLREAGPESAGHVNALVKASDTELAKLSETFAKGGEVATNALSKSLGIKESGVMDAVGHLVTDTEKSLKQQVESADFPGVGNAVSEGMAEGIKTGTKDAANASKDLAKDTKDAAKKELGIQSPSREFKEIGKYTTEGMTLGINEGTVKVIQVMQKLSKSTIDQFKNIRSEFHSIGQNAMSGLNQGLLAGRAQVLSTARSIANSVASTMKSALEIHSPSRLMRDEIGKMIPAGIALGIKENAKSVYGALNHISDGMILSSTPEIALGTASMARNVMPISAVGNTSTKSTTSTSGLSGNLDNLVGAINKLASRPVSLQINGREFVFATVDDMAEALDFKKFREKQF